MAMYIRSCADAAWSNILLVDLTGDLLKAIMLGFMWSSAMFST